MQNAPSLLELQRAYVLADGAAAAMGIVPDGIAAEERLAIHRNTATGVLRNALRLNFPAVCRLTGEAFFEGAAALFIDDHPARSAWLDEFGAGFAAFIGALPAAASLSYLADVAALERAVNRALHAGDANAIDLGRLAAVPPERVETLRLVPHPSLQCLRTRAPADLIWNAVLADDEAGLRAVDPDAGPVNLLVLRTATGVTVRRLDEDAWHFAAAVCAGKPLAVALTAFPELDADRLLGELLALGCFTDFHLGDQPLPTTIRHEP